MEAQSLGESWAKHYCTKVGKNRKKRLEISLFFSILIYLKVNKHYRHNYEIIFIRINNLPSSEIILIYDINACIFLHVTLSQFGC